MKSLQTEIIWYHFKVLRINPQIYRNNLLSLVSSTYYQILYENFNQKTKPDNNSKNVMINDFEIL